MNNMFQPKKAKEDEDLMDNGFEKIVKKKRSKPYHAFNLAIIG
jgi:hypothetical protein